MIENKIWNNENKNTHDYPFLYASVENNAIQLILGTNTTF